MTLFEILSWKLTENQIKALAFMLKAMSTGSKDYWEIYNELPIEDKQFAENVNELIMKSHFLESNGII
jgi:hypothetical protein